MKKSFVLSILLVWGLFLGTAVVADSPTPPLSELYANPERMDLTGYIGDAMEPCISLDGKYLYFNSSNDEKMINFGEPASLAAIKGFTEAPSLTLNSKELFYQKKEPDGYRIFRVTRSRDLVSDNQSN